ncbi:MAG: hypothetical protein KDA28_05900 [Phycisphaerales bacterium]|nr:hypothetical protein [Phycisphaerales bacterium]
MLEATGLGLLLLGVVTFVLGMRRRRTRTPRCPRCGDDLGSLRPRDDGPRCPECGLLATSRRALHRRPRRPCLVVASLLLGTLGAAGIRSDAIRRDGWLGLTPTWALVAGPWFDVDRFLDTSGWDVTAGGTCGWAFDPPLRTSVLDVIETRLRGDHHVGARIMSRLRAASASRADLEIYDLTDLVEAQEAYGQRARDASAIIDVLHSNQSRDDARRRSSCTVFHHGPLVAVRTDDETHRWIQGMLHMIRDARVYQPVVADADEWQADVTLIESFLDDEATYLLASDVDEPDDWDLVRELARRTDRAPAMCGFCFDRLELDVGDDGDLIHLTGREATARCRFAIGVCDGNFTCRCLGLVERAYRFGPLQGSASPPRWRDDGTTRALFPDAGWLVSDLEFSRYGQTYVVRATIQEHLALDEYLGRHVMFY